MILGLVDEAVLAGARRDKACAAFGLCARTVRYPLAESNPGNVGRSSRTQFFAPVLTTP